LYAPEVLNLLLGHLLRAILACGVAVAAAAIAKGAASAAIVTLGFTVGTWALEFVGMARGGVLQDLASYTPTSALRVFEQGEFRLSTVVVTLTLGLAIFVLAAVWLTLRVNLRSRIVSSAAVLLVASSLLWGGSLLRPAWDVSENRRNSFPMADEAALRRIRRPLNVRVFLAPEDPRLMDLDRNILSKLKRILPRVDVDYSARTRAGLFEGPADHYGEIWYEMDGRRVMSRSTTEPIVLSTLYQLAQVQPPLHSEEAAYSGHPLAAYPQGAAWIFYGVWPASVGLFWWLTFRKRS
jgi:hypothetical protein